MDSASRLPALIAVRVIVVTLLFGWATLIQISRPGAFPIDPFFFLIAVTYGLSVVYIATLRLAERYPWVLDVQLGADAILVSAFILVTGGITSYFSSLYVLPIIAASTVRYRRGALQVATLSALLYLGIVAVQFMNVSAYFPEGWSPGGTVVLPTPRFAQFTVAINLFGFFAAALLAGSLGERLRSAHARLKDASHARDVQPRRPVDHGPGAGRGDRPRRRRSVPDAGDVRRPPGGADRNAQHQGRPPIPPA
jgi:hypothetical protein